MPRIFTRVLIFVLATAVFGCASAPKQRLSTVHEGMDKDDVLDVVGNPKRTFRANDQDHWVYVYYESNQEIHQQIDFRQGKVIRVGPPLRHDNFTNQLEGAETMEEFESKAKAPH